MNAEYMPSGGDRVKTPDLHWLNINIDGKDQQGRMAQTVCTIEITAPERGSKSARFFVTVGIDGNGKPFACVTGLKANTDTTKKVSASWLDFAARGALAIGGGA